MGALSLAVVDGVARLTLDVSGEPVNTVSRAVRAEFEAHLDRLQSDAEIRAAILISRKPENFIAGADIGEFVALRTRDEALTLVRAGQLLTERLVSLGKPIVAAIHGACLGGGLEAALACSYRVASEHPKTMLGLPEVRLGIIPAAGGCQRLPRLIGLRSALDIILNGKTLRAEQALKQGLIDELVHPSILEEVALQAAARLADGWRPKRPRGGIPGLLLDRSHPGQAVVFSRARRSVIKKTGGHYPAPLAALEAVEHGLKYGITAGLDCEAAHFAELAVGEVSKQLVQVFFATSALKKDPGVEGKVPEAKAVVNVAVIGAGFMGSAIAGVAVAEAKSDVRLRDTTLDVVARSVATARSSLESRYQRGQITKHEFDQRRYLLSGGTDWAGFGRADLVIEAVFEDLEVKQKVCRAAEDVTGSECIIASNTSTIPIGRIAAAVRRPQQMIGMHFFSPAEQMPLLEVIVTDKTAPWVTASAVAFGRALGKTVIVVQDRPGFWVNRILAPYLNEAGRLLKEGVPIETLDETMTEFGFPVGPIALMDEIGLDVVLKASAVLHDAYGDRMRPTDGLELMTEQGRMGRKSGRGFYSYGKGRGKVDRAVYEIMSAAHESSVPHDDIRSRLVYAMLNEAARALDDEVVRSARDGDIGAILGMGFPPFRGGPLRHLDTVGIATAVTALEELTARYGSRFAPAHILKKMSANSERYYTNL
ncbi:MAG: enoyl-CoA hydratase/isomerase family protein [Gemmatimonadota bacterium]|nr:MAG: enoyl-CoA hydratase/isomerase family protein [Gemmatimonadota bacterium]